MNTKETTSKRNELAHWAFAALAVVTLIIDTPPG